MEITSSENKNRICSKCILDITVPDIYFDRNGVCNFCQIHKKFEKRFPIGEEGKQKLNKIINTIKKRGRGKKYDCIVGVSGGVDSTYCAYLAKKWELRVLAVHLDNGWNSEIAVSNMRNAVESLGIDLKIIKVVWNEFRDLQVAFLKASVPDAEIPTDQAIKSILFKVAAMQGVGYIIYGNSFRTEGKIPPLWSYGDYKYIKSIYKTFGKGKKLSEYPLFGCGIW